MRVSFCILARVEDFVCSYLDTVRVNDYEPSPALNPCADCVSYSPVLHQIKLCAKVGEGYYERSIAASYFEDDWSGKDEAQRIAANIAKLPELLRR